MNAQTKKVMVIAAVHLVATLGIMLVSVTFTMGRFDSPAQPAGFIERIVDIIAFVLRFPVVYLARIVGSLFPGLLGYAPFVLNSLFWSWLLVRVSEALKRQPFVRR